MKQLHNFEYVYDLSSAWKSWTGLHFIFAAWIANKDLPADFITRFDTANKTGLGHLDEIIVENPFPYYDLKTYYTENIKFHLDSEKKKGLDRFLHLIG